MALTKTRLLKHDFPVHGNQFHGQLLSGIVIASEAITSEALQDFPRATYPSPTPRPPVKPDQQLLHKTSRVLERTYTLKHHGNFRKITSEQITQICLVI